MIYYVITQTEEHPEMLPDRIELRVKGIPCIVEITGYHYQPHFRGSPHRCDSDWDYYGYEEIEWRVLDRRGKPADWLAKKLTAADRQAVELELSEIASRNRRECFEID